MGYNTTLIVLNDALHEIENDKDFGLKVGQAVRMVTRGKPVDIGAGCHANAATVIETHHADGIKLIAVGGNCGQDLGYVGGYRSTPEDMLKVLANSLGYTVRRMPKVCKACKGFGYADAIKRIGACSVCKGRGRVKND